MKCWATPAALAELVGFSEERVIAAVVWFADLGEIETSPSNDCFRIWKLHAR